jgi:hypothetical protein
MDKLVHTLAVEAAAVLAVPATAHAHMLLLLLLVEVVFSCAAHLLLQRSLLL